MNFKFYMRKPEVSAITKGDGKTTYVFKYVCIVNNDSYIRAFWYNEDNEIETESSLLDDHLASSWKEYEEMDKDLLAFKMLMGLELPQCLVQM
jgi:hypothetical protein